MAAIRAFGKNWQEVTNHVKTRDIHQIRNRATNVINFIKSDPKLPYADVYGILVDGTKHSNQAANMPNLIQ